MKFSTQLATLIVASSIQAQQNNQNANEFVNNALSNLNLNLPTDQVQNIMSFVNNNFGQNLPTGNPTTIAGNGDNGGNASTDGSGNQVTPTQDSSNISGTSNVSSSNFGSNSATPTDDSATPTDSSNNSSATSTDNSASATSGSNSNSATSTDSSGSSSATPTDNSSTTDDSSNSSSSTSASSSFTSTSIGTFTIGNDSQMASSIKFTYVVSGVLVALVGNCLL